MLLMGWGILLANLHAIVSALVQFFLCLCYDIDEECSSHR